MAKSKRVAYLVQVSSKADSASDRPKRIFYAVLTQTAEDALRQVQTLCGESDEASLADGFLSMTTARELRLMPDQPRRL
jgi:hypothetical protein